MSTKELPRGIRIRKGSYVAYVTGKDGRPILQVVGKLGCISPKQAGIERGILQKAIFNDTYEPRKSAITSRYTVTDLWPIYLKNFINEGGRDVVRQELAWTHLKPVFGAVLVSQVSTAQIVAYIDDRRAKGRANGTINRELAVFQAMISLGLRSTGAGGKPIVDRMPVFPSKLKAGEPRQGFIRDAEFAVLMSNATQPWLRAFLVAAYDFGFRKSELLNLRVGAVDLLDRWIHLSGAETKNGKPRKVKMTQRVYENFCVCIRGKKSDDFVFTYEDGSHVIDLRYDWYTLCVACKLGKFIPAKCAGGRDYQKYTGLNVHDCRRSALRNMVRRGISESVAMRISGHKTRAIFDRYNIGDEQDLEQASLLIESNGRHPSSAKTDAETVTETVTGSFGHS